ncbi:MAG: two-component system sensor histidine kinase NtrB [Thiobacillus sp.]
MLTSSPCAPGVVAEALEHLMRGEAGLAELEQCVRCDPVLAVRWGHLPTTLAHQRLDLLRALLLAVPVASGAAQPAYVASWRRSIVVAHLAQALAARTGAADPAAAWLAGLAHNLSDYVPFELAPSAHAADALAGLDADGWIGDAVRYHAEPLARGRAAHPLVRVVQLAYQLAHRNDAVDSVDVRAALAAFEIGPGESARLLVEAQAHARQLATRFGLADAAGQAAGGFERLARLYAVQAAQSALHAHFRAAAGEPEAIARLQDALQVLFGIERVCLFVPASDGLLRPSGLIPSAPALQALAVATDDGPSVLARARARHAPQYLVCGAGEGALIDEQIARLLGVSTLLCQALPLGGETEGVLVAGDAAPDTWTSPLWQFTFAEYTEALRPAGSAAPTAAPVPAIDAIPRDRVRRAVHEVANPLTIMRNYVNLLSERIGADSSVQRDLGIISDEIERVARIVRGITAAEEEAATPASVEVVSINSIVSELVRMSLGTLFAPNKVNVQIDLNPDVPQLPLQKDLLKQVLFNLAKNAVEAMPSGGHVSFSTRLVDADGQRQVEIEIADSGPGLPEAVMAKLFEPVTSQKGGDHAGLGLAISRNLVERMHGRLSCTSTPQGARFLIRLPTVQNGQAPIATTTRYGSM